MPGPQGLVVAVHGWKDALHGQLPTSNWRSCQALLKPFACSPIYQTSTREREKRIS